MEGHVSFTVGNQTTRVIGAAVGRVEYGADDVVFREDPVTVVEYNVWTSRVNINDGNWHLPGDAWHLPVFDVDVKRTLLVENDILVTSPEKILIKHRDRVRWVPSTTPGHHHVYVEFPFIWAQYVPWLEQLRDRGVIEPGYVEACLRRGYAVVRKPGVLKQTEGEEAPRPLEWVEMDHQGLTRL